MTKNEKKLRDILEWASAKGSNGFFWEDMATKFNLAGKELLWTQNMLRSNMPKSENLVDHYGNSNLLVITSKGLNALVNFRKPQPFFLKYWKIFIFSFVVVILLLIGWKFQPEFSIPYIGKLIPPSVTGDDSFSPFLLTTNDLRIQILNRGTDNIYLWGDQFNKEEKIVMDEKRIIPAGLSYFLDSDSLAQWIGENIGMNGEKLVPFDVFLTDTKNEKYILRNMLYIKVVNSKVTIQPQTFSLGKENW